MSINGIVVVRSRGISRVPHALVHALERKGLLDDTCR
jgi:hypothetical protein